MSTPIPTFSSSELDAVRPVSGDQPKPARDEARAAGRAKKAEEERLRREQEALLEKFKSRAGRDQDLIDGTTEYKLVPIDDLIPDPDQPRKTLRNIMELAASIKAEGLLQPIVARVGDEGDPRLYLVYGHRRLAAMKLLNWQYAPTMIRLKPSTKSKLAQQLMENLHRDDMDLMDQAQALRELMREEKIATYNECAERIGKSLTFVTTRIALLDLDEADQIRVINGSLSLVEGAKIARARVGNTRRREPKPATSSTGFTRSFGNSAGYVATPTTIRTDSAGLLNGVTGTPSDEVTSPPSRPAARGHFNEEHYLAGRARSRCRAQSANDPTAHRPLVGAEACGRCWEVVIRLDAHRHPEIVCRGDDD